ncbi:MAG: class I SAM-dependent methyltransferase [Bacteriovoracia bacterium]
MAQVKVEDTAYILSAGRSRCEWLSRDPFAKYLVPESAQKLFDEYVLNSHPSETWAGSLRQRYFLESIEKFFVEFPQGRLINIGAGFSTYPYILSGDRPYLEFDSSNTIAHKKKVLEDLKSKGLLPEREVQYVVCNLDDDLETVTKTIQEWGSGIPFYVLLEGVVCYLKPQTLTKLFTEFSLLQSKGSLIGLEYWDEKQKTHPVFLSFIGFLADHFDVSMDYQYQNKEFFETLQGYRIVDHRDQKQIAKDYGLQKKLDGIETMGDETHVLLEKL